MNCWRELLEGIDDSSGDGEADLLLLNQGRAGWLLSRVLLSPAHAKRFHAALGETLARHEARFGPIETPPTLQ